MPTTIEQRARLIKYLLENFINSQLSSHKAFLSTINNKNVFFILTPLINSEQEKITGDCLRDCDVDQYVSFAKTISSHNNTYQFKKNLPVKLTRWEWVSLDMPEEGIIESQVTNDSPIPRCLLPLCVKTCPKVSSSIFCKAKLPRHLVTTIISPDFTANGEPKFVEQLMETIYKIKQD